MDTRKYLTFMKDGRKHVKCTETRIDDDGNILECSYTARDDKHKARKHPHVCEFKKKEHTNTISQYFNSENLQSADVSPETIHSKMTLLGGQKNLSLEFLTSPEFNDFIAYCMVAGKVLLSAKSQDDLFTQSKKIIGNHDRNFFRRIMISTSMSVHQLTMSDFKNLPYSTIAIDEGKDTRDKNLDFVLENPCGRMEPYPYLSLQIEDQSAEGYLPLLNEGIGNAGRYGIRIACIVADGNKAQKKCFSTKWEGSLRFKATHDFIKALIFIPCLCHKINNAIIHAFKADEAVQNALKELRQLSKMCSEHQDDLKAKAPHHITTRWVYDFLLINFIRTHQGRIKVFTTIDESIAPLFPNLLIFHHLVSCFESTSTLLCEAYPLLMKAFKAFEELEEAHNPYAAQFSSSLDFKTFKCEEGGVWLLAYLLTRKGQRENYLTNIGKKPVPPHPYLNFFHIPSFSSEEDPIEHVFDEEASSDDDPEAATDDDGELDDESSSEDEIPVEIQHQRQPIVDEASDLPSFYQDQGVQTTRFDATSSLLTKAKEFLKQQLLLQGLSEVSASTALKRFNDYLDENEPFKTCWIDGKIGFSWIQVKREFPAFGPIAEIAMKLHSSPCSEASCERTISTQKLILNLQRQRSSRDLLDARLKLMRSKLKQ